MQLINIYIIWLYFQAYFIGVLTAQSTLAAPQMRINQSEETADKAINDNELVNLADNELINLVTDDKPINPANPEVSELVNQEDQQSSNPEQAVDSSKGDNLPDDPVKPAYQPEPDDSSHVYPGWFRPGYPNVDHIIQKSSKQGQPQQYYVLSPYNLNWHQATVYSPYHPYLYYART